MNLEKFYNQKILKSQKNYYSFQSILQSNKNKNLIYKKPKKLRKNHI